MSVVEFPSLRVAHKRLMFSREELDALLQVYSFFVGRGVFRDYAIDSLKECAAFHFYRHTAEVPLFKVEKISFAKSRKKMFRLVDGGGTILKQSEHCDSVLEVLKSTLK